MAKDDGGAALEQAIASLTVRDYFAAAALQGWIVRAVESDTFAADLARWAYKHADAMIEARKNDLLPARHARGNEQE